MHLLVDISAHGLGHLAQTAPVLNALRHLLAGLRLSLRSGLPLARLRARVEGEFAHIPEARDFGFLMHNAVDIDRVGSAQRYREFHADWAQRVAAEADELRRRKVDAVLSNAAYLPLAAAAEAGIPAVGMSSLNWADMFAHYFGGEAWAGPIHAQILEAYHAAAAFLCFTPGLPMSDFKHRTTLGPVATVGQRDRGYLSRLLGLDESRRWLLVAMGGMDFPLATERLPVRQDVCWLLPGAPAAFPRSDLRGFDPAEARFADLLASVDAVITKPGYGTFVEAACAATPIVYLERDDWPETPHFAAWLAQHGRAAAIGREALLAGSFMPMLDALWRQPASTRPDPEGGAEAARYLVQVLA
ncbi:MAG: hypothetical protein HZB40_08565 [Rhodocyclales bacterium]|nr:hypothetical protein [Rhodocyclales bacterium]